MKLVKLLLALVCLFGLRLKAQQPDPLDSRAIVKFLASDSLYGRPAGTEYEFKARDFIIGKLKSLGLNPVAKNYRQKFSFIDEDGNKKRSFNILAKVDLGKPSTVIIGAHYDHLSQNSSKSKDIVKKGIHNGADDNASGVALALKLAADIMNIPNKYHYNFLFVFFGAHEVGLFGSEAFILSKKFKSDRIAAVINLDMVGGLNIVNSTVSFNCFNLDSVWQVKLDSLKNSSELNIRIDSNQSKYSDDKWFRERGFASISVTTGIHDDYHRSTDDADKINYEGIRKIEKSILQLLE